MNRRSPRREDLAEESWSLFALMEAVSSIVRRNLGVRLHDVHGLYTNRKCQKGWPCGSLIPLARPLGSLSGRFMVTAGLPQHLGEKPFPIGLRANRSGSWTVQAA